MKKYLYFATAALTCVALASCEKQPEPTPDPEPQPSENVVNVSLSNLVINDYFEDYGDYILMLAGTDTKGVAYYVQFDILPETATIPGTYSLAAKTMDSEYSAFLIGYNEDSTEDDLIHPDTMSVTIKANAANYDIQAEIVYAGITYTLSATNLAATDPAWQYEPAMTTTLNETYTNFSGIDYTADYQIVSIVLYNENTFVSLELVADSALPAGTYPITNTEELGTTIASAGYNADYEYDTPSFLGVYVNNEDYYDETYYFASGEVTVSYPSADSILIKGSATSHFGSAITFSYEGEYVWETDDDTWEAPTAIAKKLAAKKALSSKAFKAHNVKTLLSK